MQGPWHSCSPACRGLTAAAAAAAVTASGWVGCGTATTGGSCEGLADISGGTGGAEDGCFCSRSGPNAFQAPAATGHLCID